jgi:hypothetical protein
MGGGADSDSLGCGPTTGKELLVNLQVHSGVHAGHLTRGTLGIKEARLGETLMSIWRSLAYWSPLPGRHIQEGMKLDYVVGLPWI